MPDDHATDAPRSRRHEEVVDAAARAAGRHGLSEEVFRDSVLSVRDDVDGYQRALHIVEKRTVVQRSRPGPGRSRDPRALPAADAVDPWSVDVKALAETSRVVGWCPACMGSGATKCATCRGAGKTKCPRCEATGVDAKGAECRQCAGQKKLPCGACKGGKVDCTGCRGAGEVEAWLEVETERRTTVCVHPMGSAARAHPRVSEPADFDVEPSRWPDVMVEDTGVRPPGELVAGLAPKLSPRERVVSTRTQRFQTVVYVVTYGTALSTGMVQVGGAPLEVSAASDWRPAELRRIVTAVGAAAMLAAAALSTLSFNGSHAWYARTGHGPMLVGMGCATALVGATLLSGLTLASRARSPLRVMVPAGALMLLAGATALLVTRDRPRASDARASLLRGDVARASLEADALRALDIDRTAGEAILDDVHLSALRAASPDVTRMAAELARPWYQPAVRAQGAATFTTALDAASRAAPTRDDPDALARLADVARADAPPVRERLLREAAMLRAGASAGRGDLNATRDQTTTALQHGADPSVVAPILERARARALENLRAKVTEADEAREPTQQVTALEAALAIAEQYALLGREAPSPTPMELRDRLSHVRSEIERDAAREASHGRHEDRPRRHGRRR
jgi:hypothetical protein